ncbi:MAG: hypothetical protein OXH36_02310, partial [Bdellovibrionales bacterium]|nr:hypothetical protein [Bdellovibrionales bacterium]
IEYIIIVCFFLLFISVGNTSPPAVPYMDQVISRKKIIIIDKCSKHIKTHTTGFIMIEVKISPKKNTQARLIATELKSKEFLNCTLSILNRIQFKKMRTYPLTRIYRFFVL